MKDNPQPTHFSASDTEWTTNPLYPAALQQVVRWKTLIGGAGDGAPVPQPDVWMGVLNLDAGGYYPFHNHPAPEIYYVISGTAEWTVGDETFTATPGMAIYHAPNVPHRMINRGTETLHTVWFWWSPNGARDVLSVGVELLEPMPGGDA